MVHLFFVVRSSIKFTMVAKILREINILQFVLLSVICVCFCAAIRYYSDTITDLNVVLSLAGRQMEDNVQTDPDVKQKEPPIQNVVNATNHRDSKHKFKEYKTRGITTLHNLCIEDDPSGKEIEIAANVMVSKKILVVYSSTQNAQKNMSVAHTGNRPKDGHYQVHYHKRSRPEHFQYIEDYPAYFTTPSCTANLHHFWADSTEGLYKILKLTNRLGSKVPNQVRTHSYASHLM